MSENKNIFLGCGKLGFVGLKAIFSMNLIIECIFTDKYSIEIINFCKNNHISFRTARINLSDFDNANKKYNMIISVNYKYIIDINILNKASFPINFHGSLLPKYRGRTPHVWAIINGEKETGITCHYMNETIDTGDIINQLKIRFSEKDTGFSVYEKFIKMYPNFIKDSIKKIQSNNFITISQDNKNATYFGKRTPIMGYLDLHKNAEDVINFVRAIASPYPGAYFFLADSKKIIINNLEIVKNENLDINIGEIKYINKSFYTRCNDSFLKITNFTIKE